MLQNAILIIVNTIKRLKLGKKFQDYLLRPEKIIEFDIKLDKNRKYKAFRIQHNSLLGPYKGGIRFHPQVTKDEVQALSMLMTIKNSATGLPYGGAKGGIQVDPKTLSQKELEEVSRKYVDNIARYIGPKKDIPAPDVNTNAKIISWMVDEYVKVISKKEEVKRKENVIPNAPHRHSRLDRESRLDPRLHGDDKGSVEDDKRQLNYLRATFTGKDVRDGGSSGRESATGRGGVIVLKRLLSKLKSQTKNSRFFGAWNLDFSALSVAIQGFGNVGYFFADEAVKNNLKVIAVSDSKGGIIKLSTKSDPVIRQVALSNDQGEARSSRQIKNSNLKNSKLFRVSNFDIRISDLLTLDIPLVMDCKKKKGSLAGCYCVGGVCDLRNGKQISNEDLLTMPVDILVPSALENVINRQNMAKIKAKIIVEMANGPVTDEAYEYLTKKGVLIIPDVLANSGGVIGSYLEWLQGIKGKSWSEEKYNKKLESILEKATNEIYKRSIEQNISLKKAVYDIAILRLHKAWQKLN